MEIVRETARALAASEAEKFRRALKKNSITDEPGFTRIKFHLWPSVLIRGLIRVSKLVNLPP